jgi:hypothetical protein
VADACGVVALWLCLVAMLEHRRLLLLHGFLQCCAEHAAVLACPCHQTGTQLLWC